MKSAAVREARQVARIKVPQWWSERVLNTVIAARLRIPRDVRDAYDNLSHRERGHARARWRRMVVEKRPDLNTRRRTRRFRVGQNRVWNVFGVRMRIEETGIASREKFGPCLVVAPTAPHAPPETP